MRKTKASRLRIRRISALIAVAVGLAVTIGVAACGGSGSSHGVTLTIEGPNQWTDSGSNFGAPWESQIARFEKLNRGVTIHTVVLPANGFGQTEATQLAAGTAPDLVFNQTNFTPHQVVPLDSYLNRPNVYAPTRSKWIKWFLPAYYGFGNVAATNPPVSNPAGHLYWVPFNLVGTALYVNENALQRAGVTWPINTWAQLAAANAQLKKHGMVAVSMDNSIIGLQWTVGSIFDMLMRKYEPEWNHFNAAGQPGTSPVLTIEDLAWAIKTGKFNAYLPGVAETLVLSKQFFQDFATQNWSGVTGLSGAVVNLQDFLNQKAAMAWGVDFGWAQVAHAPFKVGTIPFPTITSATTPLSTNAPAESGVSTGGTSYMIPSTTTGNSLKYALRFLQFMSAPHYVAPWLRATGGIPAVAGIKSPASAKGFLQGAWALPAQTVPLISMDASGGTTFQQYLEGYFLGSSDLKSTLSTLQSYWERAADYQIQQNGWGKQAWAK